jgi:hypothetical protein
LAAEEEWFSLTGWSVNEFRLAAEGVIVAHGASYPVRLLYPDQFPAVPAWVEPQDSTVKWSSHQYGAGGTLCLELRPDNWHSSATGADVLRSAHNLLREENPLGEGGQGRVASAHDIGELQRYDWGQFPVLIGSGCVARLTDRTAAGVRGIKWMSHLDLAPIMIVDAVDDEKMCRPPSADIGSWRIAVAVVTAWAEPPAVVPETRIGLGEALGVDLAAEPYATGSLIVVALYDDKLVAYHSPTPGKVYERKIFVLPEDAGMRSGRSERARGKRVGVVGLGSVGSKVAEMLVRSGLADFVLVDGDVFLPANLERHILDWRDVGQRKASSVKGRLLQICAGARVRVIEDNLSWQRSAKLHASQVDALAGCDILVDATGDVPTSLMLGALAAVNERPFVSAVVFEGGIGALVARSIPDRDPAFVVGRERYIAYCEERDIEPPRSGIRRYDALSDEGDPLIADDAAASITAAHAARTVLDILEEKVGSSDAAFLLIGCTSQWLFERHGHVIGLDVGSPPASGAEPLDQEIQEFVLKLSREALDAAKASE